MEAIKKSHPGTLPTAKTEVTAAREIDTLQLSLYRLFAAYRDVERRSLSLPAFSLLPGGTWVWNVFKFDLFFFIDLFLLIPIYLPMYSVVFVRNRFPGKKWRYRCFSIKYVRNACRWIWLGEAPTAASLVIRKLVNVVLKMHFRASLGLLRSRIELEDSLAPDERERLGAQIEEALDLWGAERFRPLTVTSYRRLRSCSASGMRYKSKVVNHQRSRPTS